MNGSAQSRILARIRAKPRGSVFTPADFLDLGTEAAIDQALRHLIRAGALRRLARGV